MDFKTELNYLLANYGNGDSVVVAVMANGSNEGVFCCDGGIVSVDEIVSIVGNADIYLDKPKLIFIQACRSVNPLVGVPRVSPSPVQHPLREDKEGTSSMHRQTISQNSVESRAVPFPDIERVPVSLPAYSDVLIGYSTLPGFPSYRNVRNGSWYIQCLVEVSSQYAFEEDVLSLLTVVNYNVSRKCKTMQGFRQIPAPQSTLTKKLFFLPGYFEDDDP